MLSELYPDLTEAEKCRLLSRAKGRIEKVVQMMAANPKNPNAEKDKFPVKVMI